MLNYLAAEGYKLRHKRGLYIGMILLLALESLTFLPGIWVDGVQGWMEAYLMFLSGALFVGVYIAPIFAILVFDDQYGRSTLKNEIVTGIPRARIYLGKLLAAMLAGTVCAAIVLGWYVLLSLLLGLGTGMAGPEVWAYVARGVVIAYLVWLAALSFTFFLLVALRHSAAAIASTYTVILVGLPAALVGAGAGGPGWFKMACRLFFTTPLGSLVDGLRIGGEPLFLWGDSGVGYALLVSALWICLTSALGLALFSRQELK